MRCNGLGTATEPLARVAYEVKTGNFVDQIAFVDHSTISWFGASPDGLVNNDCLIEIKCPNSATHWATIKEMVSHQLSTLYKCKRN
jgi:hypothetical protein